MQPTIANKDLLFNNELILFKNQLADFEDCDVLSVAKKEEPVMQASRRNSPKLSTTPHPSIAPTSGPTRTAPTAAGSPASRLSSEEQGVGISPAPRRYLPNQVAPQKKSALNVSAYANPTGAYTTIDPLRVTISSLDPRNQGDEAFRSPFPRGFSRDPPSPFKTPSFANAASATRPSLATFGTLSFFIPPAEVIRPLLTPADLPPPQENDDAVKPNVNRPPPARKDNYVPYANREGLYERGWKDYLQLLTRFWQHYLDNKSTFDDAVARMVSAL